MALSHFLFVIIKTNFFSLVNRKFSLADLNRNVTDFDSFALAKQALPD
tara:strand:+ start:557 stop:700 length:144 start_codon:yes stop_codon:yes gene_type:complete